MNMGRRIIGLLDSGHVRILSRFPRDTLEALLRPEIPVTNKML